MTEQQTITEFLEARLRKDEDAARAAEGTCFFEGSSADADHYERHNPDRVLREVEAKRRIVEFAESVDGLAETVFQEFSSYPETDGAVLLKLLALPYSDHPNYREEWRPTP